MVKTLHRFFVSPPTIIEDPVTLTDREQVHQLTRVLRMKEGDHLILLDGNGMEYEVKIMAVSKHSISCQHIKKTESKGELSILIRLFQGLPKQPSKFEEVLKHGTELGVTEFYPLITQNGEIQELRKRERMQHILRESAEQSERGKIPVLGPERSFHAILESGWPQSLEADLTLMAYARETHTLLPEVLQQVGSPQSINIVIGPEGGFTDGEVTLARERAFTIFGLGPRILRTETAGMAVVSALLFGSFNG